MYVHSLVFSVYERYMVYIHMYNYRYSLFDIYYNTI